MPKERVHPSDLEGFLRYRIARPREMLLSPELNDHGQPTGFLTTSIETADDYRAFAMRVLVGTGRPGILEDRPEQPAAYVSDGRWVIDCICGSGAAADPEMKLAICCECGKVYRPLFPLDWREGEAALLDRPSSHSRHWFPGHEEAKRRGLHRGESVADLRIETAAHGHGRR